MENGTPFRKGMEEDFGLPLLIFPLPPFPGSAVLVLDFSEAEVMKRADEMMYVENSVGFLYLRRCMYFLFRG